MNKYAEQYSICHPQASQRHFNLTCQAEIKVYFTILIYMGIYQEKSPKAHQESPAKDALTNHIKQKRYKHLKTIIKVSNIEQDDEHANTPGNQHFKISPLNSILIERFQEAVILGSKILYDKQMLAFHGHSAHVTKVPGKPCPDGFKIWTLYNHGYLYNWLYYSGTIGELFRQFLILIVVLLRRGVQRRLVIFMRCYTELRNISAF